MDNRLNLVEGLERRIGQPLPDDYRRLLLAGPVPVWLEEESPENPSIEMLHSFFDLGVDEDRDLVANFDDRDPRLPGWLLAIGELYGVLIGVGISGRQRGRVYQWSWDDGEEQELAPTFAQFLAQRQDHEST